MKTSFSEIVETERYLRGEMGPEESVVFQAKLLVDNDLNKNMAFHNTVHRLALLYRRKKIKAQVQSAHERLFFEPARIPFRKKILQLFNS